MHLYLFYKNCATSEKIFSESTTFSEKSEKNDFPPLQQP